MRFLRATTFALVALGMSGCANRGFNNGESKTEAYGDPNLHIVVAAKPDSGKQRLWICRGEDVAEGTAKEGYPISIGTGLNGTGTDPNLPIEERNANRSNLTPAGRFEIYSMVGPGRAIGENCGSPGFQGMTTRCMGLKGLEPGINDRAAERGIYIHGTPEVYYPNLGRSASHGCVRMHNNDVLFVYNYRGINTGTKVYISSLEANFRDGKHACTFAGNPGRGAPHETTGGPVATPTPRVCRDPDVSVFSRNGAEIILKHGATFQHRPKSIVDFDRSPRDPGYPWKLSLAHSPTDQSNLVLKAENNNRTLSGYRKNMSWAAPGTKVNFTATWNCDGWEGTLGTEPLVIIP